MIKEWKAASLIINLPSQFASAAIRPLASLYSFNFDRIGSRGPSSLLGCVSTSSASKLYSDVEYYVFPLSDAARRLGQLVRGGKSSKEAMRAATMALRIRLWAQIGVLDKAGNPIEGGEVRFYNPLTKQVQKQSMAEAVRWTRDFLKPLRADWRQKMVDGGDELDDIYSPFAKTTNAEVAFMEHMGRVWYLLHITEAPLNMVHEVVWRESDMAICKAMLDEIGDEDLSAFNFRHLKALYS